MAYLQRLIKRPTRVKVLVEIVYQLYSIPPAFDEYLESRLQKFSFSLTRPQELSESIRKLSNIFLKGISADLKNDEGSDYWSNQSHRAAYISYFSMLNFTRAQAIFSEARRRGFLEKAKVVADWGCGAGAASWALFTEISHSHDLIFKGIDQSRDALNEYSQWSKFLGYQGETHQLSLSKIGEIKADTLILSYVLNEVKLWPEIPPSVKRMIILEPSTHQAGRELLKWREKKLTEGWYAWAPCTHQNSCPLLAQSGKDWCHHRVHWTKPEWFYELDRFLPMRNETLTVSYLLLSREKPDQTFNGVARVVGDEQEERGKTRQMICRGPYREFLSWLHRDQISLKLHRGDLLKISDIVELKANELRIFSPDNVNKIEND
jgi:hypothetical protein